MKFREGYWDDIQGYTEDPHPEEGYVYCHPPDYCPKPCELAEKGICKPESQVTHETRSKEGNR